MSDLTLYILDRETGIYTGETAKARKSPMWQDGDDAKDQYIIPAGATPNAPPDAVDGYARCFSGDPWTGSWSQVEDHRGKTIYSTASAAATIMDSLGPIPDGYTTAVPCEHPKWDGTAWTVDTAKQTAANVAVAKNKLADLDIKSIRALRSIVLALANGATPDPEDVSKLTEHEQCAVAPRSTVKNA